MTAELVAFLRARLDEDEQTAKSGSPGPWMRGAEREHLADHVLYGQSTSWAGHITQVCNFELGHHRESDAVHIARWDPARVLAEVQAKRRMVEHLELVPTEPRLNAISTWGPTDMGELAGNMLQLLALPYAEHPDYRAEWGPDVWRDPRGE